MRRAGRCTRCEPRVNASFVGARVHHTELRDSLTDVRAMAKGRYFRLAHGSSAILNRIKGLLRELNPGPLAPEARIMPLDQAANVRMQCLGPLLV